MVGLAQYALPGIIVLTSVGAFLMCLLVIRYGFGSREIDLDTDEARRLVMTRIGHAVAAVCFAGAALLAVVALAARTSPRPQPEAVAPAAAAAVVPTGALDEQAREIARLRDALHETQLEMDEKLSAVESRVANLLGRVSAPTPAAEQPAAPGKRPVSASAPGAAVHRSDEASALPTGATVEHFRATVKGVNVDVQTRPLRNNETAYLVSLMDETNRPVTGADVTLVGKRRNGTSVQATLAPTNEPGVHRGRLPTSDDGPDLRLRVVATTTRFEVSLAREVSW
jgi:hypothetical protein